MLGVQTWRLETSPLDVIQTTFGHTWLTRMILTIILIGIWFWIERKNQVSIKTQLPMLVFALALIATTTMMGHGASTELVPPIILDYVWKVNHAKDCNCVCNDCIWRILSN